MKAIILAAGRGKRLNPLTKNLPKCLLRINGLPIIHHQIEALKKCKIRDIVLVVGYKQEIIKKYCINNFGDCKFTFILNPFYEDTNSLVSMWFARSHFDSDFLYLHSDIMFDDGVIEGILEDENTICAGVKPKKCGKEELKVKIKDNCIVEINKTMHPREADGEYTGIVKFKNKAAPNLIRVLDDFMNNKKFMFWFELSWEKLVNYNSIHALSINEKKWIEIDTLRDLEKARVLFGTKGDRINGAV